MTFELLETDAFLFWTLLVVQSAVIVRFVEAGNATASAIGLSTVIITLLLFSEQWGSVGGGDVETVEVGGWLLANAGSVVTTIGC